MKVLLTQKMAGVSGSERYLLSFMPALRARGIDAHFLVVQHPGKAQLNTEFIQELEADGVPVHVMDSRLPISPWLIWKMAKFIQEQRFELLQTNLIHADVWGACIKRFYLPALRLLSVKHGYSEEFQTRHGLDPDFLRADLMSALTRWAGKHTDRVISISEGLKHFLTQGGLISAEKCLAIPYGFDFANLKTEVAPGALRFGTPQIVVAGRVVPVKQHHLLLKILPDLVKKFPDLAVVMVGAGSLLDEMKKLTDEMGLAGHVRWEGFRSNMHDYIRDSDLMVIPSSAEGFGLVVLEAWHHAKPVVAFDVPAINEIIEEGIGGILIRPFDTDALLACLTTLLDSPSAIQALGQAGFHRQKAIFGLSVMVDRTLAVMNSQA